MLPTAAVETDPLFLTTLKHTTTPVISNFLQNRFSVKKSQNSLENTCNEVIFN